MVTDCAEETWRTGAGQKVSEIDNGLYALWSVDGPFLGWAAVGRLANSDPWYMLCQRLSGLPSFDWSAVGRVQKIKSYTDKPE